MEFNSDSIERKLRGYGDLAPLRANKPVGVNGGIGEFASVIRLHQRKTVTVLDLCHVL